MADNRKSDLEQRIEENRQKIEEISAFRDDPKIDKIIRVLQKQIAQDFYQLSLIGPSFPTLRCSSAYVCLDHLRSPGAACWSQERPTIPSFEEM